MVGEIGMERVWAREEDRYEIEATFAWLPCMRELHVSVKDAQNVGGGSKQFSKWDLKQKSKRKC